MIFLAHSMLELNLMAARIVLGVWSAIAAFHDVACA